MALIKDRKLALDNWRLLERGAERAVEVAASRDVIVPLAVWLTSREHFIVRGGRLGVWLAGNEEPAEIAGDLPHLDLIAVEFTSFTDGRGYSIGRLLRQRYGWNRELRAIGDVQRDQIFYLARCGFDAFALREGEGVENALRAFDDFSEAYQTGVDRPTPLYRRRDAAGEARQ